jgi:hypothetical protein
VRAGGLDLPDLTAREEVILRCLARGSSVRQTARALGFVPKTVENVQTGLSGSWVRATRPAQSPSPTRSACSRPAIRPWPERTRCARRAARASRHCREITSAPERERRVLRHARLARHRQDPRRSPDRSSAPAAVGTALTGPAAPGLVLRCRGPGSRQGVPGRYGRGGSPPAGHPLPPTGVSLQPALPCSPRASWWPPGSPCSGPGRHVPPEATRWPRRPPRSGRRGPWRRARTHAGPGRSRAAATPLPVRMPGINEWRPERAG